ncbi:MAG: aminotransferase class V-fold PLP-dependent enzyme [Promethearchaeota archaeon]
MTLNDLIKNQFPSLENITYLNTSSEGIPPVVCLEEINRYFKTRLDGTSIFQEVIDMFKDVRGLLSKLLGGLPGNYSLITSTTDAINAAAHSIKYPPGSNIVLCDLEFPANYIPWFNLKNFKDVEVRVVKSQNGAVFINQFENLIDHQTVFVAISHVQFSSGYKVDLRKLTNIAHERGALVLADVIQSAGAIDLNLKKIGVDFAAGQATKYLIGPVGAGFLYVSDACLENVMPIYAGWWGVEDGENFGFFERKLLPDARKFQTGTQSIISYFGFKESLRLLLELGNETRQNLAMECANYLRKRLQEENIKYLAFSPDNSSHVVSCEIKSLDNSFKTLIKSKVYTSKRNGRLRISTHFYNKKEDIDKLLDILTRTFKDE